MVMTWHEMIANYPQKWIVIDNPVFDGSTLLSGDIVSVLNDNEISDYRVNNFEKHYYYKRTAMNFKAGIINAN